MATLVTQQKNQTITATIRIGFGQSDILEPEFSENSEENAILPLPGDVRIRNSWQVLADDPTGQAVDAGKIDSSRSSVANATENMRVELAADGNRLIRPSNHQDSPERRFDVSQQWEGIVTEVGEDSIWADLSDLTMPSNPIEHAEILLDEIPKADWPLLKPGSVFYWWIGRETRSGGQTNTVSEIRVRRTPGWSQSRIAAMEAKAKDLYKRFNFNDQEKSSAKQ